MLPGSDVGPAAPHVSYVRLDRRPTKRPRPVDEGLHFILALVARLLMHALRHLRSQTLPRRAAATRDALHVVGRIERYVFDCIVGC